MFEGHGNIDFDTWHCSFANERREKSAEMTANQAQAWNPRLSPDELVRYFLGRRLRYGLLIRDIEMGDAVVIEDEG